MINNYNQFNEDINRNVNKYELEKDAYTAFVKGNSFKNLYNQYKNYRPFDINPQSEKEYGLLLIQIYGFVAHDLGLFLDVNPNNENAIKLREKYINLYNQALMEYEQKYGSLSLDSDMLGAIPWSWDNNNFPWEVGK